MLFLGKQLSLAIKATLRERTTIGDPSLDHAKASLFDATGADPPSLFGVHEPAFFEDLQVLNYGGESDIERLCQPGDRNWAFAQLLNNRPTGGIAQGMEDGNLSTLSGPPAN